MNGKDRVSIRLSQLVREAERLSVRLDLGGLLAAFGEVERLRRFLDCRINNLNAPPRPSVETRVDPQEIVRALRSEFQPARIANPRPADGLLTIPQTAELLGLSVGTIRSWLSQRKLPSVKLGRAVRIKETDARKLIAD